LSITLPQEEVTPEKDFFRHIIGELGVCERRKGTRGGVIKSHPKQNAPCRKGSGRRVRGGVEKSSQ